jgi:hypothetical protein
MKKLILITILIVCAVFLVSCSEYDKDYVYDGESLVGVWQERDFDEKYYKIYEFKADGTIIQTSYIYGIVSDVSLVGEVQNYSVEDNNTLVLSEEGSNLKTRLKFSISEDNELVLHQDGDDLNVLVPYSLSYDRPDKSPVIGKWMSETEKEDGTVQKDLFWFSDDGQCILFVDVSGEIGDDVDDFIINGNHNGLESILYATHSGNKINLCFASRDIIGENSVLKGEYEISGDKLIIKAGGSSLEYKRV